MKGTVVTATTLLVVCAQMAAFRDPVAEHWTGNLGLLVFGLLAVGIPCGAYAIGVGVLERFTRPASSTGP